MANWAPDEPKTIYDAAKVARLSLTADERRFKTLANARWPRLSWRRYHPISIPGDRDLRGMNVWFAPFYNVKVKLIVCISEREDFPYRVYGQNHALYERHGYTVLDFTEDLSCPVDDSVWDDLMAAVENVAA